MSQEAAVLKAKEEVQKIEESNGKDLRAQCRSHEKRSPLIQYRAQDTLKGGALEYPPIQKSKTGISVKVKGIKSL